jgi:hypothetical protein
MRFARGGRVAGRGLDYMFAKATTDFLQRKPSTATRADGRSALFSGNCSPDHGWRVNTLLRAGSRQPGSPRVNDIRHN